MALCDRLEAAQREREERRESLNRASLHRLNNGANADAFRDHARFHLRHLPSLTTRPEHIRDLRQPSSTWPSAANSSRKSHVTNPSPDLCKGSEGQGENWQLAVQFAPKRSLIL
jgi:hypothetical protein